MSISEEWPEFVTPEAIALNTGVWPIGVPKPRLRWRHGYQVGSKHVDGWYARPASAPWGKAFLVGEDEPEVDLLHIARLCQHSEVPQECRLCSPWIAYKSSARYVRDENEKTANLKAIL